MTNLVNVFLITTLKLGLKLFIFSKPLNQIVPGRD